MMTTLGIEGSALPIIWDADFLYGARTAAGEDSFVLCEINVSSVFAVPDDAPAAIACGILASLQTATPTADSAARLLKRSLDEKT
jgi:hypothetical protein